MTDEKPTAKSSLAPLSFAIAGVLALLGLGFLWYLSPKHMHEQVRPATCQFNLRQIGQACHMYADDYDGAFPPDFKTLCPMYVDNPRLFKCPRGTATYFDFKPGGTIRESSSSYIYVPGLRIDMPGYTVAAYDKVATKHPYRARRNVLFVDAHVEGWPADREAELQEKLAKQREDVKKWRAAGAKKEDMPKFFGESGGGQ